MRKNKKKRTKNRRSSFHISRKRRLSRYLRVKGDPILKCVNYIEKQNLPPLRPLENSREIDKELYGDK